LFLAEALSINDRGQIAGYGRLSNGDHRAFLLTPCNEKQGGDKGCDYSMVEETTAAQSPTPVHVSGAPQRLPHFRWTNRYHLPGLGAPRRD